MTAGAGPPGYAGGSTPVDLPGWLQHLETLHNREIELGLDRAAAVWMRMGRGRPHHTTITVGGTNGKGSVVRVMESILCAAGYRTGAYTSPHLVDYRERVRVNGREVGDDALCRAFARVEESRGEISLTYFEFGTLAALDLFEREKVQIAILEVGLGGRLDAVNIIDTDCAVVTSVDMDHTEYLGSDRESIGREKAGIFRPGRPAVCGDRNPPASLREHARAIGAHWHRLGADFDIQKQPDARTWAWHGAGRRITDLPQPLLHPDNVATALMGLACLSNIVPVSGEAVREGVGAARLPGRFQVIPGPTTWILDVAHNPAATRLLADRLQTDAGDGLTLAVVGMLKDKDIQGSLAPLLPVVDAWIVGTLQVPRGATGDSLRACLQRLGAQAPVRSFDSVATAVDEARRQARVGDRVVVFGSFHTVAAAVATGL